MRTFEILINLKDIMPNFFASFKFSLVIYDLLIHRVADEAVKIFFRTQFVSFRSYLLSGSNFLHLDDFKILHYFLLTP